MDILLLVGGLLLILIGANGLTDGAASVAKRFRIPSIVIGLTIVAFGTSAPELAVSVSSALKGSADIAIGNVVGSNIFNICNDIADFFRNFCNMFHFLQQIIHFFFFFMCPVSRSFYTI